MKQKTISVFLLMVFALSMLTGCSGTPAVPAATAVQPAATTVPAATQAAPAATTAATASAQTAASPADIANAKLLVFNNAAWQYDKTNDVYWQIGVQYSATPETKDYETLGIYVPGAYLTATANSDGSYTAKVNAAGSLNGFSASSAPMVYPVDTPGYMAAKSPTAYNYDEISSYMKAGFIYVQPGLRGRDNGVDASGKLIFSGGAPWGVTDLKAAIRYIRLNKDILPGNTNSTFTFGMSGGGAQSSIAGASGDSELYYPYLRSIGAAMVDAKGQPISDAVNGTMAWCPITSLDYADAAYEWNLGQFATTGTRASGTFTAALSKDLAAAYVDYLNKLGLKDQAGNVLLLNKSAAGISLSGSYYDYLKATIEGSLNNFLADTKFPYTKPQDMGFGGPGGPGGPGGKMPAGGPPAAGTQPVFPTMDPSVPTATPQVYQTVQDYINSLNADSKWVTYDAASNKATITSLADFVTHLKNASKGVGAFDGLDRSAGENNVFGNDASDSLHFDAVEAALLSSNQAAYAKYSDWKASYVTDYSTDLQAVDKLGGSIQTRLNMYNPMYYLSPYYAGYQKSKVATNWRINTGINQGDTANTVELNLSLALQNYSSVKSVDFTTVWGQAHVEAERTGDSTANFINWVTAIVKK